MHVLFDYGAIGIADDLTILGLGSDLELNPGHELSLEAIRYHREHIYRGS
jgi:putative restriction endonuclease